MPRVVRSSAGGKPGVSADPIRRSRLDVSDRLLWFINDVAGSRYKLERMKGFRTAHAAVVRWFNTDKPSIPDTASLIQLSNLLKLSLNWLFFEEGPELRDAARARGTMQKDLRQNLAAELVARGIDPSLVERYLPTAQVLYRDLVDSHREGCLRLHRQLTLSPKVYGAGGPYVRLPLTALRPRGRKTRVRK
jgi:hypothetical protein